MAYALLAAPPDLPAGVPLAAQVQAVNDLASQLLERDLQSVGQLDRHPEDRLLLAALVAGDLADVHTSGLGEPGLGEPEFGPAGLQYVGHVHLVSVSDLD